MELVKIVLRTRNCNFSLGKVYLLCQYPIVTVRRPLAHGKRNTKWVELFLPQAATAYKYQQYQLQIQFQNKDFEYCGLCRQRCTEQQLFNHCPFLKMSQKINLELRLHYHNVKSRLFYLGGGGCLNKCRFYNSPNFFIIYNDFLKNL